MKDLAIKKLYYSISEVSKITDLEQYVLRYWETEFEELKPQKNRAGNRIYTNRDIKLIMYIKKLLREERYTIEGAKHILKNYNPDSDGEQLKILDKIEVEKPKKVDSTVKTVEVLKEVKQLLEELKEKL
jgi:DNA-binding transcriptional MerR regulator